MQGVAYRAWTRDEALRRNLCGWVRNRPDGAVEAVFAGLEQDVDNMIDACGQGPWAARVDNVEIHEADSSDIPKSFEIRF